MRNIKILACILSILAFTESCKKDNDGESGATSVHGFVISENDGRRIPFADVWLVKSIIVRH